MNHHNPAGFNDYDRNDKGESITWLSEFEVNSTFPTTAFNFIKPPQNRIDDNDVIGHLPCRKLEDWYLIQKNNNIMP